MRGKGLGDQSPTRKKLATGQLWRESSEETRIILLEAELRAEKRKNANLERRCFQFGTVNRSTNKWLKSIINVKLPDKLDAVSNTLVIHGLIIDLCKTSNPTDGISFSPKTFKALKQLREFNKNNIYDHPRLNYFKNYAKVVLESIFGFLYDLYNDKNTLKELENYEKTYPLIIKTFYDWMIKYSNIDLRKKKERHLKNNIIYNISSKQEYGNMIIAYISGMTDHFAIAVFNELISFRQFTLTSKSPLGLSAVGNRKCSSSSPMKITANPNNTRCK